MKVNQSSKNRRFYLIGTERSEGADPSLNGVATNKMRGDVSERHRPEWGAFGTREIEGPL